MPLALSKYKLLLLLILNNRFLFLYMSNPVFGVRHAVPAILQRSSMNKPRIFPKSLKEGSNFKTCKLRKYLFSVIGYICKSSENLSFTVNRFQQTEITLIFVPTSIFAFSYTTAFR